MPLGSLPIRYLGIPLVSGKLSFHDCNPLLEKINKKVQNWTIKNLSYGGKIQLINFVLMAMCRYWTDSYFLPRKLIKEIEKILKGFLWGGKRKAKVSWSLICKPKEKGGLDVYDIGAVNDAYIMKNLWNVCTRKEELWVKCVHSVILKGQTIYEVRAKSSDSWLWKKFLNVRDIQGLHR